KLAEIRRHDRRRADWKPGATQHQTQDTDDSHTLLPTTDERSAEAVALRRALRLRSHAPGRDDSHDRGGGTAARAGSAEALANGREAAAHGRRARRIGEHRYRLTGDGVGGKRIPNQL